MIPPLSLGGAPVTTGLGPECPMPSLFRESVDLRHHALMKDQQLDEVLVTIEVSVLPSSPPILYSYQAQR